MFPASFLWLGLVVPGLVALIGSLAGHRGAVSAGVGTACSLGLIATGGWPGPTPVEAWGWATLAGCAGALLGLLELVAPTPLKWALRGVLTQAVVGLVLRPLVPDTFPIDAGAWRWSALSLAMLAAWWHFEGLGERLRGPAWPAVWLTTGLGVAVCLVLGGSLRLGQLAMVPMAVMAGVTLGALRPARRDHQIGIAPFAAVLAAWSGLLLNGTFYANVPEASVALCALAPVAAWVGLAGKLREGGWKQVVAACVATAVPVGLAVAATLL